MDRNSAFDLLKSHISNKNLIKHSLAVESCMRKLSEKFNEDRNMWGLAGLLHDLDYEITKDDFSNHGFKTSEILGTHNVPSEILDAIKSHPGHTERKDNMSKVLYALDPLTGLIVASVLMHPQKAIKAVDAEFIIKRFREKRFAAGANRQQIESCREFGMALEDFIKVCLEAMGEINNELGL
ncbi:MAG: HDIG domain-containing protein [Endomicrobiales bacterium]|nr:HDIG domain-containing protein [Endomicrobiales bacterium]